MDRLKRVLTASSLLECVVASVIWLCAFMVTMEIVTRIMLKERMPEENLSAWIAVKQCYLEYAKGGFSLGKSERAYDGGTLEIELMPYRDKIRRLSIRVFPCQGTNGARYDYLIKSEHDEK